VGSSILYWAGAEAGKWPGGKNLNLGMDVTWKGVRGLKWAHLDKLLTDELKHQPHSHVLVIQAGSNDITIMGNSATLAQNIQCSLGRYNVMFPKTLLIWSAMLPLLFWHGALGKAGAKIDLKRCRVNRAIRKFITPKVYGACIGHDQNINTKATFSGMMEFIYQMWEPNLFK
jgi:hypothetical protein